MKHATPHYPPYFDLAPVAHVEGVVTLPGSKSISNRTLLLAALAGGSTEVFDLLASDDTAVMLNALTKLGVHWHQEADSRNYRVEGIDAARQGRFPVREADLFMGNAGTAIRPLVAVLAVLGGAYSVHGVQRMHERPIGDLVDALNAAGAAIRYTGTPGYPPLHIGSGHLHAARLYVRGSVSSQFLTALLMAAPLMARLQPVCIEVEGALISKPYIEITLNLLERFGIVVERQGWQSFTFAAGQSYRTPGRIHVEGDASSASYFLAAGAISGGIVRVEGVGRNSIQGDIRFAEALAAMGAHIEYGENFIQAHSQGALKGIDMDFNHIPDAAMTIAVTALFAQGPTVLRNIASWRVKETDRLSAMATELRKLGARVEEGLDYMVVTPPAHLQAAEIATYDDHRMAMCFSLACLNSASRGGVPVRILEPHCVAKTFPDYFSVFAHLCQKHGVRTAH